MSKSALVFLLIWLGQTSDSLQTLNSKIQRLDLALRRGDPETRTQPLESLASIELELKTRLRTNGPSTKLHLCLYRCLAARGEFANGTPLEKRLKWLAESRDHAYRAKLKEAPARAKLVAVGLLAEDGQVSEARDQALEILKRDPEAKRTLPYVLYSLAEIEKRLYFYEPALERLRQAEDRLAASGREDPLRFRVAGTRGQIYLDLGIPDVAARFLDQEVEGLRKRLGNAEATGTWLGVSKGVTQAVRNGRIPRSDIVASHVHSGNLFLRTGRFKEAATLARACLAEELIYPEKSRSTATMNGILGDALTYLEAMDPNPVRSEPSATALERAHRGDLPESTSFAVKLRLAETKARNGELNQASGLIAQAEVIYDTWRSQAQENTPIPGELHLRTIQAHLALLSETTSIEVLQDRRSKLDAAFQTRFDLWELAPIRPGGLGFLQALDHGWL